MDQSKIAITELCTSLSSRLPPTSPVPIPSVLDTAAIGISNFLAAVLPSNILGTFPIATLSFARAALVIALAPLIWNTIAYLEHRTRVVSTICMGRKPGIYVFATWIFGFSSYRNALVLDAIKAAPTAAWLAGPEWKAFAGLLGLGGLVLTAGAYWRLGITGTFLGDYFGVLMEARETRFPFSVCDNPMYDGSSMLFVAKSIIDESPTGLALAFWVYAVYRIALLFEEPFTAYIYEEASNRPSDKKEKKEL